MLYNLYEAQRSLMEPFTDFAQAASKLYSNSTSPLSQLPISQRMAAGYDLLYRLGKDYEKPEFGIRSVEVDDSNVVIFEKVAIDKPFCELRRFKRFTDDRATLAVLKKQPVVLIVAPMSGHHATLLRDTVRTMLQGHKVYITDWKNARNVPVEEGTFGMDDYVNYVQEFIRHLEAEYGNCHVISVCQPTVPVLAAVSLMASRGEQTPLTLTMMGGPIDARRSPTAVNTLAMNKSYEWFENNVITRVPVSFPAAGRRVYPGFLQHSGFMAMNPDRHASSHYDYFKDLIRGDDASAAAHRKFYDEYNAVIDLDAEFYLDTIRIVFQDFNLVNDTWNVVSPSGEPERVRPRDITASALLTIEGELDDISGSGQTEAAHDLCTGIEPANSQHYEVKGAGHYGIFSGKRWRDMVYPKVRDFIAAHDQPQYGSAVAPMLEGEDAGDLIATPPRKTGAQPAAAPKRKPRNAEVATRPSPTTSATKKSAPKRAKAKGVRRAAAPAAKSNGAQAALPGLTPATKPVKAMKVKVPGGRAIAAARKRQTAKA